MSLPDHLEPTDAMLDHLAHAEDDGPFVALNLNRYRERALYDEGASSRPDVSGKEAYMRYGAVAFAAIANTGGHVLWMGDAQEVMIGCDHDAYDEVIAVWYPSRKAFLGLEDYPGYREALETHRRAGIEQAMLICVKADAEPKLGTPFGG